MENKTIENISRYIMIALLLGIVFLLLHIVSIITTKEEIKKIVSTEIALEFQIQEAKGNIYDSAID